MKIMGKKLSASEIDGVQYRRAKLWQIILCACNALVGMSVYSLIGMASYTASIGFGIGTACAFSGTYQKNCGGRKCNRSVSGLFSENRSFFIGNIYVLRTYGDGL